MQRPFYLSYIQEEIKISRSQNQSFCVARSHSPREYRRRISIGTSNRFYRRKKRSSPHITTTRWTLVSRYSLNVIHSKEDYSTYGLDASSGRHKIISRARITLYGVISIVHPFQTSNKVGNRVCRMSKKTDRYRMCCRNINVIIWRKKKRSCPPNTFDGDA